MTPVEKELFLDALERRGFCRVKAGGKSMWPFIRDNDLVLVERGFGKPSLGMVVAFFNGCQLIIHRIVRYKKRGEREWDLWVQGDSSPFSRSRISSAIVVGTVRPAQRNKVIIRKGFTFPFGILAVPAGFLIRTLLILCRKTRRKKGMPRI